VSSLPINKLLVKYQRELDDKLINGLQYRKCLLRDLLQSNKFLSSSLNVNM